MHIDTLSTLDMLTVINQNDQTVPLAVAKVLPAIAAAVDLITGRLQSGGRLFYLGAGTSGRLGILDAVECPPTYSTEPELVQGLIAGGSPAIFRAQEGAEDKPELAATDLQQAGFTRRDVLVGIAASGRTPYVIGGLDYARQLGAATIALSCSTGSTIAARADIAITPVTGPEVVTGSTRMKAGTAQKLVLNMLSTGTMIKLGKVYGNLMVDLTPVNAKLVVRSKRLIKQATGCTDEEANSAFEASGKRPKIAILMILLSIDAHEAIELDRRADGPISKAIALYHKRAAR